MKNKIKKTISMMLVCLMMLVLAIPVAAASTEPHSPYSVYELNPGLHTSDSVQQDDVSVSPREAIVCVMRIYSDSSQGSSSGSGSFGHSFLTFLNVSSSTITVGRYQVDPQKMVSISKFGNLQSATPDNFKGVFYNVETNRAACGWYSTAVSTYQELTQTQLSKISSKIISEENGYSDLSDNCAKFSASIWNSTLAIGSEQHITALAAPDEIYREIKNMPSHMVTTGGGLMLASYSCCYFVGTSLRTFTDPKI